MKECITAVIELRAGGCRQTMQAIAKLPNASSQEEGKVDYYDRENRRTCAIVVGSSHWKASFLCGLEPGTSWNLVLGSICDIIVEP